MINEEKKMMYEKNNDLVEKENEGKLLLFNVNSGVMFELNESAKILWTKSNQTFSGDDLKSIIKVHFNSSLSINKDIEEFIRTALKENVINEADSK